MVKWISVKKRLEQRKAHRSCKKLQRNQKKTEVKGHVARQEGKKALTSLVTRVAATSGVASPSRSFGLSTTGVRITSLHNDSRGFTILAWWERSIC